MHQLEFFDLPSPCIGVCQSGARGYCQGCYRSRAERQHWHEITTAAKRQILAACQQRRYRHLLGHAKQSEEAVIKQNQPSLFEDQG